MDVHPVEKLWQLTLMTTVLNQAGQRAVRAITTASLGKYKAVLFRQNTKNVIVNAGYH